MIVYFCTMAVFKISMSGEPAELAGIFRNESRTGRITLTSKNITCSRWGCLQSNKQLEYPFSRHQDNSFIIEFQNEIKRLDNQKYKCDLNLYFKL